MKKLLKIFFLSVLLFETAFAHPLDISSSYLSFKKNYLNITTYLHSYEIEYLLNQNNIKFKSVYEYYDHKDVIEKYLKDNIKLDLENNKCEIENVDLMDLEEYQILSKGVEIDYSFKCEKDIQKGEINVSFFNNFPLQTNQMAFYDLNTDSSTPFESIVLTSKVKDYNFDLDDKNKKCVVDTDGDGIPDDREKIYKTDPNKIDTDGDFYTDYEEIFNSWNPLDNNYGPGQSPRTEIPKDILEKVAKNKKTKEDCDREAQAKIKMSKDQGLLTSGFGNNYFVSTMEKISDYVNNKSDLNISYILLVIVGLGFVHAMGPGHSKSLLISYIIDKNKNFFDGFLYIIIFTITHLIDIVILFLFTKIVFNFYDISIYMVYIQRISLVILLFFSIFLIFRAIIGIRNKKLNHCLKNDSENQFDKRKDIKGSIMIGFVSGLAPCTFGRSIFLLLFSTGSLSLVFPMLLALGFGIFLCLLVVLILTFMLRKKIFDKLSFFSLYSSLFSSSMLLVLSLYLFSVIFNI